jgi:hypothetical protein
MPMYLIAYGIGRFWVEGLRIDRADIVAGMRWNQWVALAMVVGGGAVLMSMQNAPISAEIPADIPAELEDDEVDDEHLHDDESDHEHPDDDEWDDDEVIERFDEGDLVDSADPDESS